jgi:DNA-binding SARP family transcriptional activator/WD40 repeat protein
MDFGVLGALTVTDGGRPLALGGPVQRRLLAAMLAHAPNAVSSETLVDDVWGEAAPATALRTLHSHVTRLRDALGRDSVGVIETVAGGYRLSLQRPDVDAWVFEDLVHTATSNGTTPSESSTMLRQALSIWRGPAYAEFSGVPFADAEGRRLESLREHARDSAIDSDLASGRGADLVPELEALVVEHPFRERLWSALVVSLYRAGRQADALDAYQRARTVLGDELGVDPGPELRAVEAKVLAHDPSLLVTSPPRVLTCPWKGLAAYEPGDADFFVGRDGVVSEVIARLVDYSVVIVTGPSGSGKSSLVRAGVVPALSDGAIIGSATWKVTLLSPGSQPLDAVRMAVADAPDLLVIDPGDDLLAVPGAAEVGPVAETLRSAVSAGMRIVMTLRGDLYGRLTELNALAPRAGAGTVLVGPPRDDELRQVVELPARRVGLDVDPNLVDAVVSDVRGRPASLPLLSTALVRTWERREGSRLTLAGYVAAGGTASALERLAEEAYASMDGDERLAARRILLRLVVNDDGLWRRRRLPIGEAVPDGDDLAQRALQVLSDHRLVSIDVGDVQLSHEALTGAWTRFASWLAEREQTSGVFDHLTATALAWQVGGRDDADLYRGTRLQAALDVEASVPDELGPVEREFIASSRAAADREITDLRRGRRRLMLVAGGLVLLLVLASLAGALAVRSRNDAAQAALEADAQRVGLEALNRTDSPQKLLLAVAAVRLHDNAGTQASLLAALQDAGGAAATTVPLTAPSETLTVSTDGWIAVAESNGQVQAFAPDLGSSEDQVPAGSWSQGTPTNAIAWLTGHDAILVGASDPARVFSMNAENGGVSVFAVGWNPSVFAATGDQSWVVGTPTAPSADGADTLVGQSIQGQAANMQVPLSGAAIAMVPGPGATVTIVERGTVERVDLRAARVLSAASVPNGALVVASTDGQRAAASSPDGTIDLVDLRTGAARRPVPRIDEQLAAMALSADGSLLAGVGRRDGVIRVWSTATGVERAVFTSTFGPVHALAWSPDGARLYTTPTGVAALQAWDLASYVSPAMPIAAAGPAGSGSTTTTAVDPTSRTVAVGTDLGRPWFLDLGSGRAHSSTGPKRAPLVSVAFADDGRLVLTADGGGVLSVWDPASGDLIADLTKPTRVESQSDGARAPVGPDGHTAASFIDGFGLQLVDVVSRRIGPPVYPDLGNQSMYEVLGWSPDGRYVVVGAQGITISPTRGYSPGVWALVDPHDGQVVWRTSAPEQVVAADAVFAENGRTIILPGESGRLYFVDAETGVVQDPAGAAAARPPAVNDRQTPASLSVAPNGGQLSVVSQAHPVEIWDVATAQQSGTVRVPAETVNARFVSDHELVTTTVTGAVTLHDLSVADWIRLACKGAGRELTPIEWAQFLPTHPYRSVCTGPGDQGVS